MMLLVLWIATVQCYYQSNYAADSFWVALAWVRNSIRGRTPRGTPRTDSFRIKPCFRTEKVITEKSRTFPVVRMIFHPCNGIFQSNGFFPESFDFKLWTVFFSFSLRTIEGTSKRRCWPELKWIFSLKPIVECFFRARLFRTFEWNKHFIFNALNGNTGCYLLISFDLRLIHTHTHTHSHYDWKAVADIEWRHILN